MKTPLNGRQTKQAVKKSLIGAVTALALLLTSMQANTASAAATPSPSAPAPSPTPTGAPTRTPAPTQQPGVYLLRGSEINLVARESKVPIAIRNTFGSDVRVHVHVNPSNPRVIVPSSVEIVVPAGETVNAQVPVKAVAQGKVFLIVWLTTFSGIRLTKNNYIQMHVEPDIEFALLASFASVVIALVVVGAIRTVRRRKKHIEDAP
ncbi:MAG: DUF6049 family protein [Micrococcales bacterium]